MGSAFLAIAALTLGLANPSSSETSETSETEIVANEGQWPDTVRFSSPDGSFWLTEDGFRTQARTTDAGWNVAFVFEASGPAEWHGERPAETVRHWFKGNDPTGWVRNVPSFHAARWPNLRPGIDVVVRAVAGRPRYDLELAPGADPSGIVVRVEGAERLELDESGALRIETPLGEWVQSPPLAWNDADHRSRRVRCVLLDDQRFMLLGDPNQSRAEQSWTIDPVLVWSGFLGGSIDEEILALDRLASGELIVAGRADSCDFPVTPGVIQTFAPGGFGDGFVSRLSADGKTLLSSTFIGGSDLESLKGMAVGPGDTITVVGDSRSRDFPQVGNFGDSYSGALDVFALRLTPAADTIVWSGLVGGFFNDRANGVAVGDDGRATIVGASNGFFPTTSGVLQRSFAGGQFSGDALALRVAADGSKVDWATYLGSFGDDTATAVAVDSSGAATIVGQAGASSFPKSFGSFDSSFNGDRDGFVTRVSDDGKQLLWGTFFGGGGDDRVAAIDIDANGWVAVCGSTDSSDLPTTAGAAQPNLDSGLDAFVARFSADGSQLLLGTYLGGERDDVAHGVRAEPSGDLTLVGETLSDGFPTTLGAFDTSFAGQPFEVLRDAFLTRVDATGTTFSYSTYLGGAEDDLARVVRVLANDAVLIAGRTASPDFPRTGGTYQSSFNFGSEGMGFLSRVNLFSQPVEYGIGKVGSLGAPPRIRWLGFPALTDNDLQIGLDTALAFEPTVVFEGFASASIPWLGGTLLIQPPLRRIGTFRNDFVGFGSVSVPVTPDMIGTERYFQVWTSDPGASFGAVMTPGLMVRFHP